MGNKTPEFLNKIMERFDFGDEKKSAEAIAERKDYFAEIEKEMVLKEMVLAAERNFSPQSRKEYVEEGAEFLVDARSKGVQTMVFMDKSARPLAGFLLALWHRLWPDEQPPDMKFMVGAQLKVGYTAEDVAAAFKPAKKSFIDKTILLVDEVVGRGGTLLQAKKLLKEAFPEAGEILLGGMAEGDRKRNVPLDIRAPYGSGAYSAAGAGNVLGGNLYGRTKEVREIMDPYAETDAPIEVFVKARRNQAARPTYSHILLQVGKNETLEDKSLKLMNAKIAAEKDLDKKSRLLQIREAYEKLID